MIRKLFAAGAMLAVGVVAVMLLSLGSSAKPAEAHVSAIIANPAAVQTAQWSEVRVFGVDGHGDVYVQASAGIFVSCEDDDNNPCIPAAIGPFPWQRGVVSDASDTDELELIWFAPPGFPGGAVLFVACQEDQWDGYVGPASVNCDGGASYTIQVTGAVAKIELVAQRDYSNEPGASLCIGTPVYVIAATEYTFNNFTTFNNDRAIICARVTDSVGHPISNESIAWTVSGGGCLDDAISNTGSNGIKHNRLTSCGTGNAGKTATVTANAGVISNSVQVMFGGDPASCSIPDFAKDLDVGDTANVVATIRDAGGNLVPDGIIADFVEVDSGDGADNVEFVTTIEDTVKGVVSAKIISAIAGVTTVAVVVETVGPGPGDATCSEALDLTGDIHVTPTACAASPTFILNGSKPPAGGGFGTFLFCGGTNAQLLTAIGCPASTPSSVVVYYNKPSGGFAVWVVGSEVAATNAEWLALFPNEHVSIPNPTIFTAKCK